MTGQAKTYICDHLDAYDALLEAIKTDQEVMAEDMPDWYDLHGQVSLSRPATLLYLIFIG